MMGLVEWNQTVGGEGETCICIDEISTYLPKVL
jgi:hypothetical protein